MMSRSLVKNWYGFWHFWKRANRTAERNYQGCKNTSEGTKTDHEWSGCLGVGNDSVEDDDEDGIDKEDAGGEAGEA
jgi:hypothetical protein